MDSDTKKLNDLLTEKKFDEAATLITEAVSSPLSEPEKGVALVEMASAYLGTVNNVMADYRDLLKDVVEGLKKLNIADQDVDDKLKLARVRESLS